MLARMQQDERSGAVGLEQVSARRCHAGAPAVGTIRCPAHSAAACCGRFLAAPRQRRCTLTLSAISIAVCVLVCGNSACAQLVQNSRLREAAAAQEQARVLMERGALEEKVNFSLRGTAMAACGRDRCASGYAACTVHVALSVCVSCKAARVSHC
jgi:hypothetical protein